VILRRVDGDIFSVVLPAWVGESVVLLGAGPSLTLEQIAMVQDAHTQGRCRCIAVNDTYLVAPWADVQYAADVEWHRWHTEGIAKPVLGLTAQDVRERWASFAGEKCTVQYMGSERPGPAVHMLKIAGLTGLSADTGALVTGKNSGFQALNLAVLAGANRIILIGFDGAPNAQGKDHFHGGHPRPTPAAAYPHYRQAMSAAENALAELGVEVVNCSPGSAIDSFTKANLEDVL
jgi:hypothetical protein